MNGLRTAIRFKTANRKERFRVRGHILTLKDLCSPSLNIVCAWVDNLSERSQKEKLGDACI